MGRNSVYPYHLWTDGQWHDITPSDYDKSLASLRAILHQYAKAHSYVLRTTALRGGRLSVRFEK